MKLVSANRLSRAFGDLKAVDDLTFDVEAGEVVGLLGANGAGKTTTMRMLLGLLAPSAGEVSISGRPLVDVDRGTIGYVPQGLGLYGDLSVAENVAFASAAFGVAPPSLSDSGLGDVADRRVGDISLGMRRRVAFVVALCHRPEVLILDEPTSGVGPLGRARLWETIHESAQAGTAVLVSTHHMEEAEECDRVILMADGREVASGTVEEVIGGARAVTISGELGEDALLALSLEGGTVLAAGLGWRVVGLDLGAVRGIVGAGADIAEVPASFEEAFVALSR